MDTNGIWGSVSEGFLEEAGQEWRLKDLCPRKLHGLKDRSQAEEGPET